MGASENARIARRWARAYDESRSAFPASCGSSTVTTIVGIDLGTTNSLCAVFEEGQPHLIANAHGEFLTPSVVGVLPQGEVIVGAAAKELRVTHPDRCAWCFKRHLGSQHNYTLAGKQFTPTELSSLVLKSLKRDAENQLGIEVTDVVITVPAYFNDHQRKATRMAGRMAGLTVRRIINEPTAAALTYGFHDRESERFLCVLDLGGGTFDVTVMETFETTLEIVATAGESMLGGEDFTDRLVAASLQHVKLHLETAELKQPLRVARLREECEVAKRRLGDETQARVRVPDEEGKLNDDSPGLKLSLENFAKLAEPLMRRIEAAVDRAMRDSRQGLADIDEVILVGGATRMRLLKNFAQDYFARDPLIELNPDEVVALGAAVQAALLENDAAVDDMVMTDVCPFTLGVEICKDFAGQTLDGYFSPVIHRNTTVPVSREEIYNTVSPNQPEVLLRIFQGESRKVKDNLELGELAIKGLPAAPAGLPVHVRFTYDQNGILEVEAFIPDTGKKASAVLTNHAADMSEDELYEAVERMQQLKFYPRDDLRNQHLLRFCERMVGEVSPHHRDVLEQAIDFFEHALSAGDRDAFETSRQGLLLLLSQLGIDYDE